MKIFKKLFGFVFALVLFVPGVLLLGACGNDDKDVKVVVKGELSAIESIEGFDKISFENSFRYEKIFSSNETSFSFVIKYLFGYNANGVSVTEENNYGFNKTYSEAENVGQITISVSEITANDYVFILGDSQKIDGSLKVSEIKKEESQDISALLSDISIYTEESQEFVSLNNENLSTKNFKIPLTGNSFDIYLRFDSENASKNIFTKSFLDEFVYVSTFSSGNIYGLFDQLVEISENNLAYRIQFFLSRGIKDVDFSKGIVFDFSKFDENSYQIFGINSEVSYVDELSKATWNFEIVEVKDALSETFELANEENIKKIYGKEKAYKLKFKNASSDQLASITDFSKVELYLGDTKLQTNFELAENYYTFVLGEFDTPFDFSSQKTTSFVLSVDGIKMNNSVLNKVNFKLFDEKVNAVFSSKESNYFYGDKTTASAALFSQKGNITDNTALFSAGQTDKNIVGINSIFYLDCIGYYDSVTFKVTLNNKTYTFSFGKDNYQSFGDKTLIKANEDEVQPTSSDLQTVTIQKSSWGVILSVYFGVVDLDSALTQTNPEVSSQIFDITIEAVEASEHITTGVVDVDLEGVSDFTVYKDQQMINSESFEIDANSSYAFSFKFDIVQFAHDDTDGFFNLAGYFVLKTTFYDDAKLLDDVLNVLQGQSSGSISGEYCYISEVTLSPENLIVFENETRNMYHINRIVFNLEFVAF